MAAYRPASPAEREEEEEVEVEEREEKEEREAIAKISWRRNVPSVREM